MYDAVDFMGILLLGVVLDHLELREAVEGTAEVGLPLCLVIGILMDLTTNHSPFLDQGKKTLLYQQHLCSKHTTLSL